MQHCLADEGERSRKIPLSGHERAEILAAPLGLFSSFWRIAIPGFFGHLVLIQTLCLQQSLLRDPTLPHLNRSIIRYSTEASRLLNCRLPYIVPRCTADFPTGPGNVGGMGDRPSSNDEDLLARLNALKRSHISFRSSSSSSAPPIEEGSDDTAEDLIARFQKIHGRGVTAMKEVDTESAAACDKDRSPSPTIDELLADLGPEEDYTIDRSDIEEAQALMVEASSPSLIPCLCCCVLTCVDASHKIVNLGLY